MSLRFIIFLMLLIISTNILSALQSSNALTPDAQILERINTTSCMNISIPLCMIQNNQVILVAAKTPEYMCVEYVQPTKENLKGQMKFIQNGQSPDFQHEIISIQGTLSKTISTKSAISYFAHLQKVKRAKRLLLSNSSSGIYDKVEFAITFDHQSEKQLTYLVYLLSQNESLILHYSCFLLDKTLEEKKIIDHAADRINKFAYIFINQKVVIPICDKKKD